MRRDVLSLIVGWTMMAMLIPLSFSFLITWWLDGFNTALISFMIPILFSGLIGLSLLSIGVRSDTTERLRDREAFAAVALAWPVAVLIGSLPFWLGGVFHGPFTDGSQMADIGRGFVNFMVRINVWFHNNRCNCYRALNEPELYSWNYS